MKQPGIISDIPDLTTYVARRHSCATVLKRSAANIAFINAQLLTQW
jgi:hypothetical protein